MGYALWAWLHVAAHDLVERRARQAGQGTVEYVGIVVMVTLLIAGVAAAGKGWAGPVGGELKKTVIDAIKAATKPL